MGKQVLAALLDAADRGVKVSIVTDGVPYVTSIWGNPYFLALAGQENVEIKIYNPLRFWQPWKLMGRLHDKYLIVDRSMYILGGRNTYDFFLGDQPGYQNYDWDILVCVPEGKKDTSLEQVRDYFSSVWKISDCKLYGKSPDLEVESVGENGRRRIAQTLQGDCKRASGLDHGKRLHRRDSRSEKDDIAFKSDACLCKRAGCFFMR